MNVLRQFGDLETYTLIIEMSLFVGPSKLFRSLSVHFFFYCLCITNNSYFVTLLIVLYLQASRMTGDRVWPMPLFQQYSKQIESQVADISNIGVRGRYGGPCTAAAFLKVSYNFLVQTVLDC